MRTTCQDCGVLVDVKMIYHNSNNTAGSPPSKVLCSSCYTIEKEGQP